MADDKEKRLMACLDKMQVLAWHDHHAIISTDLEKRHQKNVLKCSVIDKTWMSAQNLLSGNVCTHIKASINLFVYPKGFSRWT